MMLRIIHGNEAIGRLMRNAWVQVATLDPASPAVLLFRDGRFVPYEPESVELPVATSSLAWYRGWRDHLGYAAIEDDKVTG